MAKKQKQKKFQVILADPPWPEKVSKKPSCGGQFDLYRTNNQYDLMTADEIKNLPIQKIVNPKGCILFMWSTFRHIPLAVEVIKSWGFTYKTIGFIWVKPTIHPPKKWISGPGYYTKSNSEPCLIATCGRVPIPGARNVHSIIEEPRRKHSQKPEEAIKRIERMYSKLNKVELFCRYLRKGWSSWGNEIKSDIKL
ncbi:adenine methyltransferase [Candidatus Pacearchaeota archaeon]|nr:adenine methyltransferase [Candidatus Pacearchaeota archaeon]